MAVIPTMPAPLPKWYRWAVKGAGYGWGIAQDLLDYSGNVEDEPELQWRRLTIEWTRTTPAGTSEDHAFCTFDFVNITGGQIDTTWTTADYQAVETPMGTWGTAIASMQSSDHTAVMAKWYRMQFANPMTPARRFVPTGPPLRVVPLNKPGILSTVGLPYQVAASVTERTSIPSHWGRFYLPGLAHGNLTAGGRLATAVVDGLANATWQWYDTCQTAEIFPVVVSTQFETDTGGTALQGTLIGVDRIQVDDVPDVIRKRRAKQTNYRKIVPALP